MSSVGVVIPPVGGVIVTSDCFTGVPSGEVSAVGDIGGVVMVVFGDGVKGGGGWGGVGGGGRGWKPFICWFILEWVARR